MLRAAGWVFLGFALTGCSAIGLGGSKPAGDEPPPLAKTASKTPARHETPAPKNEKPASAESRIAAIEENQDQLNKRTQQMAATLSEVRSEIEGLRGQIAMEKPSSPAVTPLVSQKTERLEPAPTVDVEGRVAELLARLKKDGKRDSVVTGVAQELSALGPRGVAKFMEAMRNGDFASAQAIERAIEQADPKVSIAPLREGLSDPGLRVRCIRLLGAMKDDCVVPDLAPLLKDESADVRFNAADALVKLEYKEAIPVLIEALGGSEDSKCAIAFQTLSAATGQSLGYRFYDSQEKREAAARLWSAWWDKEKKTFEFGHH